MPVVVYSGNIADADLLRCLLEGEGIQSYLQDEFVGKMEPFALSAGGVGAVKIMVADEDVDKVRPIVEDYIKEKSRR